MQWKEYFIKRWSVFILVNPIFFVCLRTERLTNECGLIEWVRKKLEITKKLRGSAG